MYKIEFSLQLHSVGAFDMRDAAIYIEKLTVLRSWERLKTHPKPKEHLVAYPMYPLVLEHGC